MRRPPGRSGAWDSCAGKLWCRTISTAWETRLSSRRSAMSHETAASPPLLKRHHLGIFVERFIHRGALAHQVVVDRRSKSLVCDLMRRECRHGDIAARELMLALSAGLDARQPA